MISLDIIKNIVNYTNLEIDKRKTGYTDQRFTNNTDVLEIQALFGLLYLSGRRKDNHLAVEDMFSGSSEYKCIMSEMRFKFLLICIRFDDKNIRNRNDKYAPIRDLWNSFISNWHENYSPHMYLTIDEQLLG